MARTVRTEITLEVTLRPIAGPTLGHNEESGTSKAHSAHRKSVGQNLFFRKRGISNSESLLEEGKAGWKGGVGAVLLTLACLKLCCVPSVKHGLIGV